MNALSPISAYFPEALEMTGYRPATFIRWKPGEPRESRVFPPLTAGHPAAGDSCPACGECLGDGTPVQLLTIGPTDDEDREKHRAGRWYSAFALLFHADCLGSDGAT